MTQAECRKAARKPGFGRKWIGTSHDAREAAGCVLWEEGNVEFNTFVPATKEAQRCNVRGTCLCRSPAGGGVGEMPVVGAA